jgi:hypothetical protein
MDDKDTQAKAKFILELLKPDAKLKGVQGALIPRIKAKYDEMQVDNKRLTEMIQEATDIKARLDANRATIAELEGVLWDEFQRANGPKPKLVKKKAKKNGGAKNENKD